MTDHTTPPLRTFLLAALACASLARAAVPATATAPATLPAAPTTSRAPADDAATVARVRANVRRIVMGAPAAGPPTPLVAATPNATAATDLASMRPDGSWADQDYADHDRVHWRAVQHLPRLERIAHAAYDDGKRPDAATLDRIVTSLRFWLAADPRNDNWWHNQIDVPRRVGTILTILGDDAPQDVRDRSVALMRRAAWKGWTGANLLDMTWVGVMRGCIAGDAATLDASFARSWQELRIVAPGQEGVQADGSFLQHGPLLYNNGYGAIAEAAALKLLDAADGAAVPQPTDAMRGVLACQIADGDLSMRWRGAWDWSASGRSITRVRATLDKTRPTLVGLAARLGDDRVRDAATRPAADPQPIGDRHFWRADYHVHRTPDAFVSVHTFSTRTANTDILTNGENKRSHHIADGATTVMVDGGEYAEIYPVWDWERIPGTTVELGAPVPLNKIRRMGERPTVGGVSDGVDGCCAMDFARDALRARKAWFFLGGRVVCLGAGIACETADHEVVTTLNQPLHRGPVYADGQAEPLTDGEHHLTGRWLWHDRVGYASLDGAPIDVRLGKRTGAWSDIGAGPEKPVTADVFCAWRSNGIAPRDATYAYAILPGTTREQVANDAWRPGIVNTAKVQAALDGGVVEAAFYEPGEVTAGEVKVVVDRPAAILLRGDRLSVASLTNVEETVRVTVDGRTIDVTLPGGVDAGRTVTVPLPR